MQHVTLTKISTLTLALLAALSASQVMAADPVEHQVQLIATIPSDTFHVLPSIPGWIDKPQRLEWISTGSGFGSLTKLVHPFDARNTSGEVHARLTDGSAILTNGSATMDLKVSFAGVELTGTSQRVVSAEEASAGKRVNLEIEATTLPQDLPAGDYTGQVNMTFDAVVSG